MDACITTTPKGEKKKTKKEKHIFISYSLGRLTLVKKDERAKNP